VTLGGGTRSAYVTLRSRSFAVIAKKVFYMGPSGSGATMKLGGEPLRESECRRFD